MNTNELLDYLTLRIIYKDSPSAPFNLLKNFDFDTNAVFSATASELKDRASLSTDKIKQILSPPREKAIKVMKYCDDHSIRMIPYSHPDYPSALKNLFNPPMMIFVKGNLPDFDKSLSLSVVGTRNATENGLRSARFFSYQLAKAGAVIISGGAIGIDAEAHAAAIEANGITVSVIGCGIGYNYPVKNQSLRTEIVNSGAIISEYLPDERPLSYHFPIRNRIIAALSRGTLVVEAGMTSGALLTADLSLEQGNDIFAVPGNLLEPSFDGTNKLIHDGAKPVFSAIDILEEYPSFDLNLEGADKSITELYLPEKNPLLYCTEQPKKRKRNSRIIKSSPIVQSKSDDYDIPKQSVLEKPPKEQFAKPTLPEYASPEAVAVMETFDAPQLCFDDICERSGMKPQDVLSALSELELFGFVSKGLGNNYLVK